jgi:hypothetical protein
MMRNIYRKEFHDASSRLRKLTYLISREIGQDAAGNLVEAFEEVDHVLYCDEFRAATQFYKQVGLHHESLTRELRLLGSRYESMHEARDLLAAFSATYDEWWSVAETDALVTAVEGLV